MGNNGKILLALLGGAAAGVALGLLLAPEKGADTREKLLSSAKDLTGDLGERVSGVRERVNEKISDLKEKVSSGKGSSYGKAERFTSDPSIEGTSDFNGYTS